MSGLRGAVVAAGAWLVAGTAALAAPADVPVHRAFQDWVVDCDSARACTAKSAPEQGASGPQGSAQFQREAGPQGRIGMTLSSNGESDATMLRLDGQAFPEARWLREPGHSGPQRDEVLQLVRALTRGSVLQLSSDPSASAVSLRGLAAALRFIDEVQGRVGNAKAFMPSGQGAASKEPATEAK